MARSRFILPATAMLATALAPAGVMAEPAAPLPVEGTAWPAPMSHTYAVIGNSGRAIGTLMLIQGPTGVLIRLEILPGGLKPGWHGMHFHSVGDCSDVDGFRRSAGHIGMREGGHGLLNPEGPEAGDLPNLYVGADGAARAEFFTPFLTLAQGAMALLDADGSALIVHADADDQISQPIGGAGARVACAAIR